MISYEQFEKFTREIIDNLNAQYTDLHLVYAYEPDDIPGAISDTEAPQRELPIYISPDAKPNPSMPDVYTLGHYVTKPIMGVYNAVRAEHHIVLYYGSFAALGYTKNMFALKKQLADTIWHELRHHAGDKILYEDDVKRDRQFKRERGLLRRERRNDIIVYLVMTLTPVLIFALIRYIAPALGLILFLSFGVIISVIMWRAALWFYRGTHKKKMERAREYFSAGMMYLAQKRMDRAIHALKKAIALNPQNVAAYHQLGHAYFGEGMVEKAIAAWKKTITLQPHNVKAHNDLGIVYKMEGMFDEAIAAFETALKLDPNFAATQRNLNITTVLKG